MAGPGTGHPRPLAERVRGQRGVLDGTAQTGSLTQRGRRGLRLKGRVCPRCGGFARQEPGGLHCLHCGHAPLFRWILPRDHWPSGTDWRNRVRQAALDRAFMNSGHVADAIFDMLERLEGGPPSKPQEVAQPK